MKTTEQPRERTTARKDLSIILIIAVVTMILAVWFDAFDEFVKWYSAQEEPGVLEEMIVVICLLPVGLGIFSYRRWREVGREIAECKQTEAALKQAEGKYRSIFDNAMEGIFQATPDGKYLGVNPAFARMCGFHSPEEMVAAITDIESQIYVNPDDSKTIRALFENAGLARNFETRFKRIDGEKVWVLINGRVVRDESGNTRFYEGTVNDITDRKRAEDALRENEALLQAIVETARDSIFVKDTSLRYVRVNAAMELLFGKPRKELIGCRDADLFGAQVAEHIEEVDRRVLQGQTIEEFPSKPALGKMRHFHSIKVPLLDGNGRTKGICGIARDITETKRAEEERRRLEERLQRTEKMEALGILAGGVAHDLNNVLGIVVGYAELLLDDVEESSSARDHALEIFKGGQRAAMIVQDLLTLARRGVPSRKVLNLNSIVLECQSSPEFSRELSYHPNVEFKTDLEADLLNMSGSSVHIEKSVFNLFCNAVESMPRGGTVTIRTANRYLDNPISGYDEVREGDYVVLSVSDAGEGIPAHDLRRIFEPFYTKKIMGRSGTGLGLAVVWGTVKDHRGYINVESEQSKGTTFTLYFPVTREELTQEQISVSAAEYMGRGESILIVDDIKEQRELASTMLRKLNYSVASVSSGREAVGYLKQNAVELVVLDMIMDPGMDGLDTYLKILEIQPHQKAIIVSGFSETERVSTAQALGAGAYVRKPYLLEKLGLAVRKELDRPA